MSAGTRRRLEDALNAGKDIENDSDSVTNGSSTLPSVEVDFGDVMGVYSVNFSYNQQYLVSGCGNGAIQVYECSTRRKKRPLKHGSLYGLPITSAKFFPFKDDQLITASADGTMTCWDLESWNFFKKVDEPHNEISAMDFSHDGKIFGTAGKDRKIRVYDTSTLQLKLTFGGTDQLESTEQKDILAPEAGHGRKVFALKFHPFDDNIFLTGGWDRCLKVWDVRSDQVVRSIHGPYICGDGIDIWEDSVLTASWVAHDALQIWDFGSGRMVEKIPFPHDEHGEFLYVGRFCASSDVIAAGGSGTNDLKIINRKMNKVISSVDEGGKPIQALDVSSDGNKAVIGSTGNCIKIVTLT
ncbi:uncharacterized protein LOC144642747 [Oculina patagonica]